MTPPLHPDVTPLAFLLGTWQGSGSGSYPTIAPFEYAEAVSFAHVGKPFLSYVQRTWAPADQRPLHAETGYLRPGADRQAELVIAQPSGIVEIDVGPLEGRRLLLRSRHVFSAPTAKEVTAVEREIVVAGDELRYELRMAAVGQPLTHHLAAVLRRVA